MPRENTVKRPKLDPVEVTDEVTEAQHLKIPVSDYMNKAQLGYFREKLQ